MMGKNGLNPTEDVLVHRNRDSDGHLDQIHSKNANCAEKMHFLFNTLVETDKLKVFFIYCPRSSLFTIISQDFMEPEGSLPCLQEPSTGPYPEPDQSNPYHPILSL
jgi:hypothetical protein